MMPAPVMQDSEITVGTVCRLLSCSRRMVSYYVQIGLIHPTTSGPSLRGWRKFSFVEISRLKADREGRNHRRTL